MERSRPTTFHWSHSFYDNASRPFRTAFTTLLFQPDLHTLSRCGKYAYPTYRRLHNEVKTEAGAEQSTGDGERAGGAVRWGEGVPASHHNGDR